MIQILSVRSNGLIAFPKQQNLLACHWLDSNVHMMAAILKTVKITPDFRYQVAVNWKLYHIFLICCQFFFFYFIIFEWTVYRVYESYLPPHHELQQVGPTKIGCTSPSFDVRQSMRRMSLLQKWFVTTPRNFFRVGPNSHLFLQMGRRYCSNWAAPENRCYF